MTPLALILSVLIITPRRIRRAVTCPKPEVNCTLISAGSDAAVAVATNDALVRVIAFLPVFFVAFAIT